MDNGWIKIHRKILENPIASRPKYLALWLLLLLKANHKEKKMIFNNTFIVIKEGQFITGRDELSKASGLPSTTVERILKYLENGHQIEQSKTTKYRLITIVNWKEHQGKKEKADIKRTSNGHQMDTNKNEKKVKKVKTSTPARGAVKKDEVFTKEGADILKAFEVINSACRTYYGRPPQRRACEALIKDYGLDRVLDVISKTLPITNGMEYFPTIITPVQLFEKWASLESNIKKYQSKLEGEAKKRGVSLW